MRLNVVIYILVMFPSVATTVGAEIYLSEILYYPSDDTPPVFIELYNSSDQNVDVSGWEVKWCKPVYETFAVPSESTVPSYGFFLIGFKADEEVWSGFSYPPDCYAEYDFGGDPSGCGVALYDVSGGYIDAIGWGTALEGYYEGEPFVLVAEGNSVERKSGPDHNELKGNSYDTDNNVNDCRERASPQPQNINSSREQPSLNAEEYSIGYIKAMYDYQE